MMLSGVIADLAELAIATNKIANSATYSSGYKDAKMSDITLQKRHQRLTAEIVARMLENYPHKLTDSDVESVASLLADLIGPVAAYLIEQESKTRLKH